MFQRFSSLRQFKSFQVISRFFGYRNQISPVDRARSHANDACTNTRAQLPRAACKPRKAEVTHARENAAEPADGGCFSTVLMQRQKLLHPRNRARARVFARVGTTRTSTPRYCDPCVSITLKFRFPSFTSRQGTMDFRLPLFYVFNTNDDESFNEQCTRRTHETR